ncbi:hypothetical protein GDO78_009822 [Eleutherodactylus coqui]|uniref:A kinase-anchoring proteins AKAP-5 and AKAP-12 calmodulin (CaM)-binding domain-containing protein n=1 Tax=Eleutherodactylus coqui TaxID=57060 RepID=A0A8J6K9I5_ELECQ|nr:hypothetical protein GDO78_009822 [Eleutherodactylus coqui]
MLGTITLTVEQQEPSSVTLDEEPVGNMGVAHNDTTTKETPKEDGQVQTPEATDTTPDSEEKAEPSDEANENQNNEVGFKKVFKFVGFKFTVKKDKNEKSEPVQLLTVKKDEVEVNGTDNHEEHSNTADDTQTEIPQETKDAELPAESPEKPVQAAEAPVETPEEIQKKVEECDVDKDQKSPVSPTNPVAIETSSPFRRFFTQGWAGLRKKTSFKKSREEDPQEVEKHIKIEEQEKAEVPETVKEESITEAQPSEDHSLPQELSKSPSEDSKESEKNHQTVAEEKPKQEETSPDNEAEVKLEEVVKVDEVAPVAENTECAPEIVASAPEATILPEIKAKADTLENKVETQITDGITAISSPAAETISEDLQGTSESGAVDNDQPQLAASTECGELEISQEAITTEAELLSSQEKAKMQGSPLKKLFSSSGLRKLSGKKSKSKKDDDGKVEVMTEAVSSVSPEAPETDGGESSPSSPEESAETSPTEKTLEDVQQAEEADGEGATSDGERRKDGVTPWASFKKLVTPKRRPKRPSESDKEDEVEKTKTSTMSSTDSGGTVEHQEEPKETNEEQKLEKSTDESKKKVDSSVSWEALICVGSSKKRARKTSDSDEEEGIKSPDEAKKTEEVVATKETESDSPITSSQEQQIQESTSPDQAGSPTEADGVSTWQSFKRLVTPRRKSRTRVEEKTDETTTVASAEQSTSEGEAGKEETWVSFKKLIPGRKKKKSDGKQEHASESGQPLTEATEDDSDEPAVVPLSEFDAAEQEKLDAQKSLKESLPTVLVEQEGSLEKSTEELIHAVTITVIEGERAITSLEERSPSWISAKVSETIEHAKETEESTKRIKTEITVEETMVLNTVSQVIAEMPNTVNEMELTSEALTALEEAIENSCAEETTEMISAVSQLGESVSTEEVTPVPEEDASAKTLEDQKKHTENILHEAAEKAKLTIDTLQLQTSQDVTNFTPSVIQASVKAKEIVCESAPLCAEEQTNLTPDALEDQDDKSTIVRAEETVQQICISVIEKTKENAITSETLQDNVNAPVINEYKTVNICTSASVSKEEPSDQPTILLSTEKSDGNISISSENQVVKATPTSNETKEITPLKMEEKCVDTSDSVITEHVIQESSTTLEAVCAKDGLFSAEDVKKNEDMTGLTEIKESVCALAEVQDDKAVLALGAFQVADNVPALNELQTKECGFLSAEVVSVSSELQPKEVAPPSSEEQPKEVAPPSSELQPKEPKEVAPASSDEQPKEVAPASRDEQPKAVAPASSDEQPKEVAPLSSDEQAKEVAPASSDEQPKEVAPASSDEQLRDVAPAPSDEQPKHGEPAPSDEQPKHGEPAPSDEQLKDVAPASSDEQPKEVEPASSDEQLKDVAPTPSDEQPKHGEPAPSDEHPKDVAPVPSEGETISTLGTSSDLQLEKIASVLNEVKPEECVCLSNEFQAEGVLGASNELQFKVGSVSSEVKNEEIPLSEAQKTEVIPVNMDTEDKSGILASTEMESEELKVEECLEVPVKEQAEENVTLSDYVKAERGIALLAEVQGVESVPVLVEVGSNILAEVKTEEITLLLAEVDTEKSVAVLADLQFEEQAPESAKVQSEENAPISSEVQAEDNVTVDESANLPVDVQAEENLCMSDELKTEETSSALPEVQAEDNFSVSPSVPTEEVGNRIEESSRKVEIQAEESVEVANEVKSTEVTPVVDKEIVQTNECLSVLDDTQTEISAHAATEVQTEQIAPVTVEQMGDVQSKVSNVEADKVAFSVEMQVDGKASEEHIEVATVNDVHTEENVLKVVENVQESEKDLSFTEHKESGSDNQIQKLTIEEAVAETHVSKQETIALQIENVCTISNIEFKDTLPSTAQEEAKEPEIECKEDKITSSQGKTEEKEEGEVVTENIPELESLEEIKASEPVTPAAEEEQVLVETVKTIEMSKDSIESSEVSKDNEVLSKGLQVVVKSVSQKAAAIVDAAIEAATNSFVVVATSQGATVEETTVSAKVKVTEETNAQKIRIDSCSTTSVQNIIETTVESVVNSIHVKESISVQGPNLQIDSQVQKTLHKPMEPCPQLKESEQKMTEEVKKIGKEIELSVPEPIQCKNEHQVSTQASEVNAQEKTPTVKS